LEHLALSPQCGFASLAAGNALSEDDQWRKLELVVDTARKSWGEGTWMQTTTVDTARSRTHCWVAGPEDGEPLLIVHGNPVTGRFFQALAERMPTRFRVVAPDLRSFGRTAAVPVDASRGLP